MKLHHFVSALWTAALLVALPPAFAQPDSLWSRTFGGPFWDWGFAVQQTPDGGYVVAGNLCVAEDNTDFWLIRTDANGDSLWSRTFGGYNWEDCFCVHQISDGGFLLAGVTYSFGAGGADSWLVKTDRNGDSLWSRTFGGHDWDKFFSLAETDDGGYILGGSTASFGAGGLDFWLVKVGADGDSLWSRTYGGSGWDRCFSVQQTSDGGYILAGFTESFGAGDFDFWLLRTDADGDSLWSRTYGGSGKEHCRSVLQTPDGGYVLAGFTESFGLGSEEAPDFWLVRVTANGDSLWSRTYGGRDADYCHSAALTSNGGFILAGYTCSFGVGESDFWLVRTNSYGDSLWSLTFGGDSLDECHGIAQTSNAGYILIGFTTSFGAGDRDFWVMKTGPESGTEPPAVSLPAELVLRQNYPNPFNSITQIGYELTKAGSVRLEVFDLLGREVGTVVMETQSAGNHGVTFDGSGLGSGIYFCRLQVGDFVATKKMVLLK